MREETTKEKELDVFKSCLYDFWGEKPTKRAIVAAWKDYLDSASEDYEIEKDWYKLSKEEKEKLYDAAGL